MKPFYMKESIILSLIALLTNEEEVVKMVYSYWEAIKTLILI